MQTIKFDNDDKGEKTHKLQIEGWLPFLFFELPMTHKERNRIVGTKITYPKLTRKQLKKIEKKLDRGYLKFFIDSVLRIDHYSETFRIQLTEN